MHVIDDLTKHGINLGQQIEHGVSKVEFDITPWLALYPVGTAAIAALPGVDDGLWITCAHDGVTTVYLVAPADLALSVIVGTPAEGETPAVEDINVLTWTVQEEFTMIDGEGTVIVHCTESGNEKQSPVGRTFVAKGHVTVAIPYAQLQTYLNLVESAITTMAGTEIISVTIVGNDFVFTKVNGTTIVLEDAVLTLLPN